MSMRERILRASFFLVAVPVFSTGSWAARQPPRIAPSAALQMDVLVGLKTSKTTVQDKIDSRLFLGLLHRRGDPRLAPLTDFRFVIPEADGRVPVDVAVVSREGVKPVIGKLASLGGEVEAMSYAYLRVSARIRLEDLEALAALPEVRKVRQKVPALAHQINVSEGDKTHGAELARSFFGISGAGVKICVISTGVDSLDSLVASDDLPAGVDVVPGQEGIGDEGSGMLEIIHDLAPGADLGFATGFPNAATFAQNILTLAGPPHDCDVIVDNLTYVDESPFQDGPLAQAVDTVTAAGVLYFSAAGSEGNLTNLTSGTWEGDFLASSAPVPPALAGAELHDFGDGGNSIAVEFGGGNAPMLSWAEHYDLASGIASTDFDLYVMDDGLTTIFDASTDVQNGVGGDDFPLEFIGGGVFTGERLLIDRFAAGTTSSVPTINLIVFRGELDDDLATSGATRGHSAAADALSVAATPAAASFDGVTPNGPFPGLFTSASQTEVFSSDGPRRILLGPTGAELTPGNRTSTGGVVRQKPDVTAADGVSVAAAGFNPFFGTSAAAAHAAAIAGLIQSALPAATPAQVRSLMIDLAIDIEAPGVDRDSGAGIVMAEFIEVDPPPTTLSAGVPVPTEVLGDGDAFVEMNETWSLIVPLTNLGGANVTAISATLSTPTPGVTIGSPSSTYPDLAPGASGNNVSPYVFTVPEAVPCGQPIRFDLAVTASGNPTPVNFIFSLKTGSPGIPVTVSYLGSPVAIPDGFDLTGTAPGAPVSVNLSLSSIPSNVHDLDFRIDGTACSAAAGSTTVGIDHSFVNDLELTLIAPDGTSVRVIDNTDGGGNNFCQTLLDDESAGPNVQSVVTANAPFTGSFAPALPLSMFDGLAAKGDWQLRAQDFFSQDTGNIRSWSLIVTPAVCDSLPQDTFITGTKTVSGFPFPGGTITYAVVLTNTGSGPQVDNPGNEFTDTLPDSLSLVSAASTSGTAVADISNNLVTWNGSIPAGGSVTITITASIVSACGPISNQGEISFDADGDGTNDSSGVTDDPSTAAPNDPTIIQVAIPAILPPSKRVNGNPVPGQNLTYTVVLPNLSCGVQPDDPASHEFIDVLPASLTVVSASADGNPGPDGIIQVSPPPINTVTWNGTIPLGGSVTITFVATVNPGTAGQTISNQGTCSYDSDGDGTHDATCVTDDPSTPGVSDPTVIVITNGFPEIPTLTEAGLAALFLALAGIAVLLLRRRHTA